MVAFNTLPKLCVVVAFGLSTTATSTEVAQEQPKKESVVSGSLRKNDESTTKPVDLMLPTKIETQDHCETGEPSSLSLEWLLLPEPQSRKRLLDELPFDLAIDVSMDFNEPIKSKTRNRIRKFFSLSEKEQQAKRLASYGF
ncbi:SmORF protein [Babesia bovis T2Bo]|uniref:SmORF n=1 Tax=Babesia bovis TaxID=5865 RepID=A7AUY3_BABBO|nr:SmORF protein [Babesia bovis T2Bo]EDO05609.1 SmORF protein [Babesia bovis T2Bo]|eukprot:XP_001609177.1 SmORF [Babesia bovis T2Bo]